MNDAAIPPIPTRPDISRGAIDRAGKLLHEAWTGRAEFSDDVFDAIQVMVLWRETFQVPMSKTATGLRSMVRSERTGGATPLPVSQRLKREQQMLFKLARFPKMKLSRMGDIGGCRAVLNDRDEVDRVAARIRRNWQVDGRERDTRDDAADSGYRGLHICVIRDGRRVEIQLRERREQEWAVAVERTGARLGIALKEGEGPVELHEYFRLASLGMYRDSMGIELDVEFDAQWGAARRKAAPFLDRSET